MLHLISSTDMAVLGRFSSPPELLSFMIDIQNHGPLPGTVIFELIQNGEAINTTAFKVPGNSFAENEEIRIPYQDNIKLNQPLTVGCRIEERPIAMRQGPPLLVIHHVDDWNMPPASGKLMGMVK